MDERYTVALWADRRPEAGFGHISRTRAIGTALESLGMQVIEIDRHHLAPADMIVVDDYTITYEELYELRRSCYVVMIDDTEGLHYQAPVDLLVRPVLERDTEPENVPMRVLAGPEYLLMDAKYGAIKRRQVNKQVQRVLLTVGASDPNEWTKPLMEVVANAIPASVKLSVVIGPRFSPELEQYIRQNPCVEAIEAPSSLVSHLLGADIVVCAGGNTLLQAARCGCPSVSLMLAENQRRQVQGAWFVGFSVSAGSIIEPDCYRRIDQCIHELVGDEGFPQRLRMSRLGQLLVDGGGAKRVAARISQELCRHKLPR